MKFTNNNFKMIYYELSFFSKSLQLYILKIILFLISNKTKTFHFI